MPKTCACPYYRYEKPEGTIVCEAGSIKPDLRDDYIKTYCAGMNYTHCTLARTLTLQYETRPPPSAAGRNKQKGGKGR